ncbi:MAG: tetratricopeptide repeat protein [Persicimonas sp.]
MEHATKKDAVPDAAPSTEDLEAKLDAFVERSLEGRSVVDLFGLDDAALNECLHYAHTLYLDKNFEQAATVLRGVVALDPEQSYAHFLLGEIAFQRQDYETAFEALETAHALDDTHADTMYRLGELYVRASKPARAAELLERCLSVWEDEEQEPPQRARALLAHAERLDE